MAQSVVLNSNTYYDLQVVGATRYMENDGHRTWLFPMLQDLIVEAQAVAVNAATATTKAGEASASATTASNAVTTIEGLLEDALPLVGTSATSMAIADSGTVTPTLSVGRGWTVGTRLRFTNGANYMEGTVGAYDAGSGASSISLVYKSGSGTFASWDVGVTGDRGATGATGAGSGDMLAANNLSDLASASTARTNLKLSYGKVMIISQIMG